MRPILIICTLLVLSAMLSANPIMPMLMSEVWFTDSEHCMVEFFPYSIWYFASEPLYISDGNNQVLLPIDPGVVATDSILVLDITVLMPDMSLQPEEGNLKIQYLFGTEYSTLEGFSWGSSFSHDINPPLPGQSLVHWYNYNALPEGDRYTWYKDMSPTPGEANPYTCGIVARDTLHIVIVDQNNAPLTNLPLYWWPDYGPYGPSQPYGYTDGNGVFADTVLAGRWQILLKHPQTGVILFNQSYWLEPNQTTNITVQINITTNDDEVQPIPVKGLQAYPVPFNLQTTDAISFKYDGNAKLTRGSFIRLYDAKGRFITQIEMSAKGMASWKPASELGSGLYLARLVSGNRIVDTITIPLMK